MIALFLVFMMFLFFLVIWIIGKYIDYDSYKEKTKENSCKYGSSNFNLFIKEFKKYDEKKLCVANDNIMLKLNNDYSKSRYPWDIDDYEVFINKYVIIFNGSGMIFGFFGYIMFRKWLKKYIKNESLWKE